MRLNHDAHSCPYCWENRRGRTNHRHHWGYRAPRRPYVPPVWEILAMQRPADRVGGNGCPPPPGQFLSGLPALYEFLTDSAWDDGGDRQVGTLLVFADGGLWKACLNDRDGSKIAFTTASTVEDLVLALERGLMEGTLDWRAAAVRKRS